MEQTFEIMKRRFAILHYGIRTDMATAVTHITACVIIKYFAIEHGDIIKEDCLADGGDEHVVDENGDINANHVGNIIRQQLINIVLYNEENNIYLLKYHDKLV